MTVIHYLKRVYSSYPKKYLFLIVFLLCVGMIVRVSLAINSQLWRDEVYTFYVARENDFKSLLLQLHWDTAHPPLYYIFQHYWQRFGIDPMTLRIPSLLISGLSLLMVPVMLTSLGFNGLFQVVFLAFFALSPKMVMTMALARPYAFEIFFLILSLFSFGGLIRGSKKSIWLFVVSGVLVFMSDYSGVWLLVGYGVFWLSYGLFVSRKLFDKFGKTLFLSLCTIFVLLIPSLYLMYIRFATSLGLEEPLLQFFSGRGNPIIKNLWQLSQFSGSLKSDIVVKLGLMTINQWSALLLIVSMIGILYLIKESKKVGIFIISLSLFPTIFSFVFSVFVVPIFLATNLNVVSFAIIFGYTAFVVWLLSSKLKLLGYILLICMLLNALLYGYKDIPYVDPPHDWKKLSETMLREIPVDDSKTVYIISQHPEHYLVPILYYSLLEGRVWQYEVYPLSELPRYFTQNNDFFVINFRNTNLHALTPDAWRKIEKLRSCRNKAKISFGDVDYLFCGID